MNRISKIFQPLIILPKNAIVKNQELTSKSQRLMTDVGLIRSNGNGSFFVLPLLQRSVEKLTRILDYHMEEIDGQKITMPTLTAAELWKKTGRFEKSESELMLLKDRHEKLQLLSPTHEEAITSLLASISPVTYRNFPLRIYQVTSKFRDEIKPRFGLIRAKEFLMKDLYTFDLDLAAAQETYEIVNEQYSKIFKQLRIPFVKIAADTGAMGGSTSHEYHVLTSIGEDQIVFCRSCSKAVNKELCLENGLICEKCNESNLDQRLGIELGHTFILEDKYSKVLNATYLSKAGKPVVLQMGCYGIGVTRLIAASIEYLSTENEIRWPLVLVPFKVLIIPPKEGSKEEQTIKYSSVEVYQLFNSHDSLKSEVVIDDRTTMTIGRRLKDAQKLGIPYVIVIGGKASEEDPKLEVHSVNDNTNSNMTALEAFNFVVDNLKSLG